MFIISKKNFLVRRADGSPYRILKNFIGEIPQDVAESGLVRRAMKSGDICAPEGTKDRQMEAADEAAREKAAAYDLRPDAGAAGTKGDGATEVKDTGAAETEGAGQEKNGGKGDGKRATKKQ